MFNPNPYLPSFPMPYQPPQTNGLLFVNGRESAIQYQLPPNSTIYTAGASPFFAAAPFAYGTSF